MKAIIASLMVVVSPPVFAEESPDLLKKKVSYDGTEFQISELFEIVGMNLDPSPNIVFKGAAGEQKVHRLRVKGSLAEQKEHHKTVTFQDESRKFLME